MRQKLPWPRISHYINLYRNQLIHTKNMTKTWQRSFGVCCLHCLHYYSYKKDANTTYWTEPSYLRYSIASWIKHTAFQEICCNKVPGEKNLFRRQQNDWKSRRYNNSIRPLFASNHLHVWLFLFSEHIQKPKSKELKTLIGQCIYETNSRTTYT